MFKKNIVLTALSFLVSACSLEPKEAIVIGIGLPLAGKMADYGQKIKRGAELALEEINASGGIHGRPLEIDFQDTQADPKQAVAVAQKFIADPKVSITSEFGSPASMAVAPLYQKAGLVMCSFFATHPDLTKPGDYIWGTDPLSSKLAIAFASYIQDLGMKKIALFFLNNDWGKEYSEHLVQTLVQLGVQVGLREAYLPEEKDFRPLISKAKAQGIDGFALVSYIPDASLLVQQIRAQGLKQPISSSSAIMSDQFPKVAGPSAEGVYISGFFYLDESRPEISEFIQKWKTKYPQEEPDVVSVNTYDGIILTAYALRFSDGTRASVKEAMGQLKDVPSVIKHKVSFNPVTRRIEDYLAAKLIVENGKVVLLKTNQKK